MKNALTTGRVPQLIASRPAFVLERLARGGGATNWYFCAGVPDLEALGRVLRPGSSVTFYFAINMSRSQLGSLPRDALASCIRSTGDALVLVPRTGTLAVRQFLVIVVDELDEEFADLPPDTEVLFGPYPGPENDGIHSVTLELPDADGILRPHPH